MQEFKLIVAGGRDFRDAALLHKEILHLGLEVYKESMISIVSGMARGADQLGYEWAKHHMVQVYEFPANWKAYGKSAGYRRNKEMAEFADGLLAFWDGQSSGTKHMIDYMNRLNKPVHIIRY